MNMVSSKVEGSLMEKDFENIFKNHLKITTRSIAVRTLLSERNIRRINYKPYYQRNYVWDAPKATFFIESVLLGTEIPPLVFFKSGKNVEIIDGRQRFETLKRFKESDISLRANGLMKLQMLNGKSFNKIGDQYKEFFLDSKIRIFEFEVINEPRLDDFTEDKIKKEIFRRYNTGITPLKTAEIDNAKYDDDELTALFKNDLKNNPEFLSKVKVCFFNKKIKNNDDFIAGIVDFYRRYIILTHFPIISYADGNNRTAIRELLYEFVTDAEDDIHDKFLDFKGSVAIVLSVFDCFSESECLKNRLVYECLLWGVCVLKSEGVDVDERSLKSEFVRDQLIKHVEDFSQTDSHYYKSILKRFERTSLILSSIFDVDFSDYIRREDFRQQVTELRQSEEEASITLEELSTLRVHKPDPTSIPIEEMVESLQSSKYLIRPSYQRQEKINLQKASAIIESILLGVYLPPIFIYKNKAGVKEVIDGQQRLLSIMGFLGRYYTDEHGDSEYSKNNNFSLKGLKVLQELNGSKFSSLNEYQLDKIYDFDLNIIEIDSKINPNFSPVDLFIRLNNKPYPIRENSFEMWNSSVDKSVIQRVKELVNSNVDWFYIRKIAGDRYRDRMENEEMVTILSYLKYINDEERVLSGVDFYPKLDRLNCRLKDKKAISNLLVSLTNDPISKNKFLSCIDCVEKFTNVLGILTNYNDSGEELNALLNVKSTRAFKRSLQDFYILWAVIGDMGVEYARNNKEAIVLDIRGALKILKNTSGAEINADYSNDFLIYLQNKRKKYSS